MTSLPPMSPNQTVFTCLVKESALFIKEGEKAVSGEVGIDWDSKITEFEVMAHFLFLLSFVTYQLNYDDDAREELIHFCQSRMMNIYDSVRGDDLSEVIASREQQYGELANTEIELSHIPELEWLKFLLMDLQASNASNEIARSSAIVIMSIFKAKRIELQLTHPYLIHSGKWQRMLQELFNGSSDYRTLNSERIGELMSKGVVQAGRDIVETYASIEAWINEGLKKLEALESDYLKGQNQDPSG